MMIFGYGSCNDYVHDKTNNSPDGHHLRLKEELSSSQRLANGKDTTSNDRSNASLTYSCDRTSCNSYNSKTDTDYASPQEIHNSNTRNKSQNIFSDVPHLIPIDVICKLFHAAPDLKNLGF